MFPETTGEMIHDVFYNKKIGEVKQVDFIPKMNNRGEYYHSAFVHFDYWFDSDHAKNIQERILCNPNLLTRVVYDNPYFWVIQENKSEKCAPGKPKLRIDLSDLKPRKLEPEFEEEEDSLNTHSKSRSTIVVDADYFAYLQEENRDLKEENMNLRFNLTSSF
jgi:hypothetical protein